ncbi:DUF3566 domain-containing protein [Williamsia phyllosphaerae]|uniref:DUF3566 domain-containing protein n=1 Tax=Williamsia phyllosphaerae TaxID=885042 RepID=A0ABQ1UDG1_9NOCA|nr:DUF3566 domain-containing protein [Williamsia phyllosphaerae]GGF16162.1 hypothetical protein GCM10007298_10250 [Williamsia phyllosphaerae]
MSTPNEPEGSPRSGPGTTERPEGSDSNGVASRPAENGGQDNGGAPADAPRNGSGTGPGGMPPWQRVGNQRPPSGGPVQPNQPGPPVQPNQSGPSGPPPQQGQPNGAPKRPLVTGSAVNRGAASSDQSTTRSPIAKLDADGNTAEEPSKGRNSLTGKVIDGPTRNIDRNNLPEDLPDLDAIHHPSGGQQTDSGVPPVRPVETFSAGPRGPLRAAVQLRRIDPWSTFKISSVLAIALFLIWMIAIGVLYVILDGMGVWDQLNGSFGDLVSSDSSTDTSFQITAGTVFGIAALVGAVYVVVFTALTTVGAFIYNMSADLVGGVEVTLADRD